jgi:hypothetical protein
MNIINWIRQTPLIWSFTTQQVGLAHYLFEAPSRQHAQAAIIHHMRMMFGDDIDEMRWGRNEEDNADVLVEYIDGKSEGASGYLKLVNDKIKTIGEVMDNYVDLTDAEKARKAQRIAEFKKKITLGSNNDYSDYYNPQININPFGNSRFDS